MDREKLTPLLLLKYHDSLAYALTDLGRPEEIGHVFAGFQKYLYQPSSEWPRPNRLGELGAPSSPCEGGSWVLVLPLLVPVSNLVPTK